MFALGLSVLNALKAAQLVGVDTQDSLHGLTFNEDALEAGQQWVPWADTALLFDRLEPALTEERIHAMVSRHMGTHPAFRILSQFATSPSAWLDFFWKLSGPVNPMATLRYSATSDPHVFEFTLRDDLVGCRCWMRLTHLAAVYALTPLGGPALSVVDVEFDDRRLRGRYRAPVEVSSRERLARAATIPWSTIFSALDSLGEAMGPEIRDGHFAFAPDLAQQLDEVRELATAWGLTPAEARVCLSLAGDRSIGEVADDLGIAVGTVRSHLKHVYAKTGVKGQHALADGVRRRRLR
jgi:DNA-binding CsgD family transcriptional regulator